MHKRTNRARIIAYFLLIGGFAHAESVKVDRKPLESSRSVQIRVVLGEKPQKGVTVTFYKEGSNAQISAVTNENGIATPPKLKVGDYDVVATLDQDISSALSLHVVSKRHISTFSLDLTQSFAFAQQAQRTAEALPVRDFVKEFSGTVVDPSGAFIPSAAIRVVRRGSPITDVVLRVKTDAKGSFSGELGEGLYIALVSAQGFRTQIIPFEVRNSGSGDLRVMLQVGTTT